MSAPGPESIGAARAGRFARVRARMEEVGVGTLLLSLGADLPWLTGYTAMPLERPTVLVVTADALPVLIVPELEAPRVTPEPELFALLPWSEHDDPVELVARFVPPGSVAVSDRMWASLLLRLEGRLSTHTFMAASGVTGPVRARKDAREVAALRAAGAAADTVAVALLSGEIPLIGRSEAEVSAEIGRRLIAAGHERVNFAIVGSGPNAASPHHEPGERVIGTGESVVCDFGGVLRIGEDVGYCSDTTRTVFTGAPSARFAELYGVLEEAQRVACAAVSPGMACEEIDAIGRAVIAEAGYGARFIHRIGHGIGIEEHEDPYLVTGNATPLEPGHACSVEPGIYLPGEMGARIEDILVVTEEGSLACNATNHGLAVVEA